MMKEFPPPDERKGIDTPWDELALGVNPMDSFREIVEDFWPIIVQTLNKVQEIDIRGPQEEAWFHLRRVNPWPNPEQSAMQYASGRIEILRIKRNFVSPKILGKLRNLPKKYGDVVCAGWWPCPLGDMDNVFFSFAQKLSVLRYYNGIMHEKFLGRVTDQYDKCPYCQEAYRVMIDSSKPWHDALTPWFSLMKSSNMSPYMTHQYAHWFGLILSGWP